MIEEVEFKPEQKSLTHYPLGFYSIHLLGIICGISLIMFIFSLWFLTLGYKLFWGFLFIGTLPPLRRLN